MIHFFGGKIEFQIFQTHQIPLISNWIPFNDFSKLYFGQITKWFLKPFDDFFWFSKINAQLEILGVNTIVSFPIQGRESEIDGKWERDSKNRGSENYKKRKERGKRVK